MPDQRYPSLRSWIIAGLVFLFLFSTLHVLALRYNDDILRNKQRKETAYLLKHVVQKLDQEKDKTRVVVLGSSLVGQGVSCAEEFSDTVFRNISLSKIFLNTHLGVLKTFTETNVFDSLLLHPPDLLLIEVDQLSYHIEQNKTVPEVLSEGAIFLRNVKTASTYGVANYRMPEYCGKIINAAIVDSIHLGDVNWRLLSFEDHKETHPYLERLRQAGVRVILVQIPRPSIVDQAIHSESKEKELLVLLNQYKQKYQMDYWRYPDLLPFYYFYDQGHLNKKGRMHYSEWLYTKIKNEIQ